MSTELRARRIAVRRWCGGNAGSNRWLYAIVNLSLVNHGISHARGKQFIYDEGLHVPPVIAGPGIDAASVRDDVVEHIDIAALSLGAAGIPVPDWMQARDILAEDYEPREAVFAARDRCDETVDHMRSVRTREFKYIRNFLPERPYLQPNRYKDAKHIIKAMREWHAAGELNEAQSLIMRETRPPEELYDVVNDPHEIHNLADDPDFADQLVHLRGLLDQWMEDTGDQGRTPESEERYDSEKLRNREFPGGALCLGSCIAVQFFVQSCELSANSWKE